MNEQSIDPIAAVIHPDPYPYYRELAATRPIYYDKSLKLWIAASATAVTAVLTSEACRVRPIEEPVPKALMGSPADTIFSHLVRMTDGEKHNKTKAAVKNGIDRMDFSRVPEISERWARHLVKEFKPQADHSRLSEFTFNMPTYVVADLLGFSAEKLPRLSELTGDLVGCFSPLANDEQIERGKFAAAELIEIFHAELDQMAGQSEGLLFSLARNSRMETGIIAANAIGFLTQSYEATAGLIGNTLVALSRNEHIRQQVEAGPRLMEALVKEIIRYDPPVQNTRRFVAEDGILAGQKMKAGDAILVLLAAANHDHAFNPNPEKLDIFRTDSRDFTFGVGVHACPGKMLAGTIAGEAIKQLMESGVDLTRLNKNLTYRRSVNARIPIFSN
jgi:cytochrome P450